MSPRKFLLGCLLLSLTACAPSKRLAATAQAIESAAASEGAIRPESFKEDTDWNQSLAYWKTNPPGWAKKIPGLVDTYVESKAPLRGSDGDALGVHIYRRGGDVAMVSMALIVTDMDQGNAGRSFRTMKAVTRAAVAGHPEAADWLDEAFAASEKLSADYQLAAAKGKGDADFFPVVQKEFGDTRVIAYTGDVAGIFILPK